MAAELPLILPGTYDCDYCHESYNTVEESDACCEGYLHEMKRIDKNKLQLCDYVRPGKPGPDGYPEWRCCYVRYDSRNSAAHKNEEKYHGAEFIKKATIDAKELDEIRNAEFQIVVEYDDTQNILRLEDFLTDTPEDRYFHKL